MVDVEEKKPRRKKRRLKSLLRHKIMRMRNIFSVISIILIIILTISLINLGILTPNLILEINISFLIVNILGIIFINVHRKNFLKIIGSILLIISIIISIIFLYYSRTTSNFINNNFNNEKNLYIEKTYCLIGINELSVSDTNLQGTYGVYTGTYKLDEAVEKLNKKYSLTQITYDDINDAINGVINYQVNYILIDKIAYESYFIAQKNITKEKFKIIDTFNVYIKNNKDISNNKKKFNILLNTDKESKISNNNILLTINLDKKDLLITYLPINTYIKINNTEKYDKLAYINMYGQTTKINSIEDLFETEIDYTLTIDEEHLKEYIDYISGIKYCSNDKINVNETFEIENGCSILNSSEIIELLSLEDKDMKLEVINKIARGMVNKILEKTTSKDYNELLNMLGKTYETNIPNKIAKEILNDLIFENKNWKFETQVLNGDIVENPTISNYIYEQVETINQDELTNIKNKINEALN